MDTLKSATNGGGFLVDCDASPASRFRATAGSAWIKRPMRSASRSPGDVGLCRG